MPYEPITTSSFFPSLVTYLRFKASEYLVPNGKILPTSIDFSSLNLPFLQCEHRSPALIFPWATSLFTEYSHLSQTYMVSSPTGETTWNSCVFEAVKAPPAAKV